MPERQYPPRGQLPSLISGDHELRLEGRARGVLSGVSALPEGVLAHLWTVTWPPVGWDARLELPGDAVGRAAVRAMSWTDDGVF